jgi:hypothetical protein
VLPCIFTSKSNSSSPARLDATQVYRPVSDIWASFIWSVCPFAAMLTWSSDLRSYNSIIIRLVLSFLINPLREQAVNHFQDSLINKIKILCKPFKIGLINLLRLNWLWSKETFYWKLLLTWLSFVLGIYEWCIYIFFYDKKYTSGYHHHTR